MEKKYSFVKTENGTILLQVSDDNQWGFYLCDEDQSWDGGFGIAKEWEIIPRSDVPADDLERLEDAVCQLEDDGYDLHE